MPSPHCIERLAFEVDFESPAMAFDEQARLAAFAQGRALQVIAEVFEQAGAGTEVWQFDTLAIDLGTVAPEAMEAQWEQRLRQRLAEALQAHQARLHPEADQGALALALDALTLGATVAPLRRQSLAQTQLAALLHFLQRGHLPWNMSGLSGLGASGGVGVPPPEAAGAEALAALAREVLRHSAPALRAAWRSSLHARRMVRRAVRQWPPALLAELTAALGAGSNADTPARLTHAEAGPAQALRQAEAAAGGEHAPGGRAQPADVETASSRHRWQALLEAALFGNASAAAATALQSPPGQRVHTAIAEVQAEPATEPPPQADRAATGDSPGLPGLCLRLQAWIDASVAPAGEARAVEDDPWPELLRADALSARATLAPLARSARTRRRLAEALPDHRRAALVRLWLDETESALLLSALGDAPLWATWGRTATPAWRWAASLQHLALELAGDFRLEAWLDSLLRQHAALAGEAVDRVMDRLRATWPRAAGAAWPASAPHAAPLAAWLHQGQAHAGAPRTEATGLRGGLDGVAAEVRQGDPVPSDVGAAAHPAGPMPAAAPLRGAMAGGWPSSPAGDAPGPASRPDPAAAASGDMLKGHAAAPADRAVGGESGAWRRLLAGPADPARDVPAALGDGVAAQVASSPPAPGAPPQAAERHDAGKTSPPAEPGDDEAPATAFRRRAFHRVQIDAALARGSLAGAETAWSAALANDADWLRDLLRRTGQDAAQRRRIALAWPEPVLLALAGLWWTPEALVLVQAAVHSALLAAVTGPLPVVVPRAGKADRGADPGWAAELGAAATPTVATAPTLPSATSSPAAWPALADSTAPGQTSIGLPAPQRLWIRTLAYLWRAGDTGFVPVDYLQGLLQPATAVHADDVAQRLQSLADALSTAQRIDLPPVLHDGLVALTRRLAGTGHESVSGVRLPARPDVVTATPPAAASAGAAVSVVTLPGAAAGGMAGAAEVAAAAAPADKAATVAAFGTAGAPPAAAEMAPTDTVPAEAPIRVDAARVTAAPTGVDPLAPGHDSLRPRAMDQPAAAPGGTARSPRAGAPAAGMLARPASAPPDAAGHAGSGAPAAQTSNGAHVLQTSNGAPAAQTSPGARAGPTGHATHEAVASHAPPSMGRPARLATPQPPLAPGDAARHTHGLAAPTPRVVGSADASPDLGARTTRARAAAAAHAPRPGAEGDASPSAGPSAAAAGEIAPASVHGRPVRYAEREGASRPSADTDPPAPDRQLGRAPGAASAQRRRAFRRARIDAALATGSLAGAEAAWQAALADDADRLRTAWRRAGGSAAQRRRIADGWPEPALAALAGLWWPPEALALVRAAVRSPLLAVWTGPLPQAPLHPLQAADPRAGADGVASVDEPPAIAGQAVAMPGDIGEHAAVTSAASRSATTGGPVHGLGAAAQPARNRLWAATLAHLWLQPGTAAFAPVAYLRSLLQQAAAGHGDDAGARLHGLIAAMRMAAPGEVSPALQAALSALAASPTADSAERCADAAPVEPTAALQARWPNGVSAETAPGASAVPLRGQASADAPGAPARSPAVKSPAAVSPATVWPAVVSPVAVLAARGQTEAAAVLPRRTAAAEWLPRAAPAGALRPRPAGQPAAASRRRLHAPRPAATGAATTAPTLLSAWRVPALPGGVAAWPGGHGASAWQPLTAPARWRLAGAGAKAALVPAAAVVPVAGCLHPMPAVAHMAPDRVGADDNMPGRPGLAEAISAARWRHDPLLLWPADADADAAGAGARPGFGEASPPSLAAFAGPSLPTAGGGVPPSTWTPVSASRPQAGPGALDRGHHTAGPPSHRAATPGRATMADFARGAPAAADPDNDAPASASGDVFQHVAAAGAGVASGAAAAPPIDTAPAEVAGALPSSPVPSRPDTRPRPAGAAATTDALQAALTDPREPSAAALASLRQPLADWLLSGPPADQRPAWWVALESPQAAQRLLALASPPLLARLLGWLRPAEQAAVSEALSLLHAACRQTALALSADALSRLQWRFVLRELMEEGRVFDPSGFVQRQALALVDWLQPPEPQRWLAALAAAAGHGSRHEGGATAASVAEALAALVRPVATAPIDATAAEGSAAPAGRHPIAEPAPAPEPLLGDDPDDGDDALADGEAIYLANAGLVLAHPYIERLFGMLGLLDGKAFRDDAAAERAVHLLHYLATGATQAAEPLLVLGKLLCGLPLATPLVRELPLTEAERNTVDGLLQALIAHWKILGNTSVAGLRETFLQREGRLTASEEAWQLCVEPRAFDMLLDQLPWGYSLIKLPWMERPLHVDWR